MKKFVKGMHKDSERVDQPDGTLRDALNANLYYSKGAVVNEQGTRRIGTHRMHVIGTVPLLNNEVISFCYIDKDTLLEELIGEELTFDGDVDTSAIVLTNVATNTSKILYTNPNLNFRKTHPIVGEFRVDSKREIIVYFTDNYSVDEVIPDGTFDGRTQVREFNPPRAFNVTRQLEHLKSSSSGEPYKILYEDNENFTVDKLCIFAKVGKHSVVKKAEIFEGGVLVSGAYHLALCYSDENFLETDYFTVSNPVYIYQSKENQYPADVITGCQAGSQTNKAIKFKVQTFFNTNYKFLQPTIIQRVGNAEFAHKLERIELANYTGGLDVDVVYTGNEDSSTSSVEDIIIDNVGYLTAKAITQLDDRLYLANLKNRKDIGFQRYANNITLETVTLPLNRFDIRSFDIVSLNKGYAQMLSPFATDKGFSGSNNQIGQTFTTKEENLATPAYLSLSKEDGEIRTQYFEHLYGLLNFGDVSVGSEDDPEGSGYNLDNKVAKGYKDFRLNYKNKSYRRGDVYAFYISFVLKDGTETYAYHIPGRAPLAKPDSGNRYQSERASFGSSQGNWQDIQNNFGFYPSEIATHEPDSRIYQYVDTSMFDDLAPENTPTGTSYNGPVLHNGFGYWENINEFYPDTKDFFGGAVDAAGGAGINTALDLRLSRVRHHRMPSNLNPKKSFLRVANAEFLGEENAPTGIYGEYIGNEGYFASHQSVIPFESLYSSNPIVNQTGFDKEYRDARLVSRDATNILGIKLKNLKIPKHILKQVQGYKIYYAKRKDQDKLITGQSLAIPAHPRYASVPTQNKLLARRGPYKNGFYLYGGLEHTDDNAMVISARWKQSTVSPTTSQDSRYVGHPVFTFHDFTMLRKRPTLENITHMSCQAGVIFRYFTGGPNLFEKPADVGELNDGSGGSKSGKGGASNLTVFPSLGWIHPDLGNTTDFDIDGQVVDVTDNFIDLQEDVQNPFGVTDDDGERKKKKGFFKRVFGKFVNREDDGEAGIEDDMVKVKDLQIRQWRTGVFLAADYIHPQEVMKSKEFIKGGSSRDNHNKFWDAPQIGVNQMIFRVDPNSKIYARGQANIQVPESTSFKGAQILYNRGGESSIAIGLDSGLPNLKSYRRFTGFWDGGPENNTPFDISIWGDHTSFLYPDAFYHEPTPDYMIEGYSYGNGDPDQGEKYNRGYKYGLEGASQAFGGYPTAWLVNLESARTDVYNPMDKQELVWTGYYKAINPKIEGEEVIGLDTGQCEDDYGNVTNYYTGAESGKIFGGDTYITRYAFRTTSHSYGHCFFRAAIDRSDATSSSSLNDPGSPTNQSFHSKIANRNRFQADLPDGLSPVITQTFGKTGNQSIWSAGVSGFGTSEERFSLAEELVNNVDNWVQGNSNPQASLFSFLVESDDNIGLRHKKDVEAGVTTKYFDADIAAGVLFAPPTEDLTKQDNLLYNENYSYLQDIRVTVPYPKRTPANDDIVDFPNRVIRSKAAGGVIGDQFRQFLANDYKDIPKNRGDIWSLFTASGLLMIHTERSLFRTQGKETLAIGDVSAFIGSGNIFEQEPTEVRDTKIGYGGTSSVYGGVSTPYGRFFVSSRERKIFNYTGELEEVVYGMESWLRDNMPFRIQELGIDVYADNFNNAPDAPTGTVQMGFTVGYDPVYKRVLVTKREPVPTRLLLKAIALGKEKIGGAYVEDNKFFIVIQPSGPFISTSISFGDSRYFKPSGWTLSYYPELKAWGSRHSYLPKLYVSTPEGMYSYKNTGLHAHDNIDNPGNFYGEIYPFEVEFIDNSQPSGGNIYSSVVYWADVKKRNSVDLSQTESRTNPGFTSFYVYNTTQISAISTSINYLNNIRKVDTWWHINSFRDLAKYTTQTSPYINSGKPNVVDKFTTTIEAPISSEPMFLEEGSVNPNYIDSTKPWHMQKRFVDNFMGVRLSNDNSSTNLLYLYAAGTKFRKSNR